MQHATQAQQTAQDEQEAAHQFLEEILDSYSYLMTATDTEELTDIIKQIAQGVEAIEQALQIIKDAQTQGVFFAHEIEQVETYRVQAIATQNSATYYYHMLTEINELWNGITCARTEHTKQLNAYAYTADNFATIAGDARQTPQS